MAMLQMSSQTEILTKTKPKVAVVEMTSYDTETDGK